MRDIIDQTVDQITPPAADTREAANTSEPTQARHSSFLTTWPCLQSVEVMGPVQDLPAPETLTVAAWNLERCKRVEDSAALLRHVGADVVLATEMDLGMARSDQRHTTRDLAACLGFGYAFGVEFVELGTGDPYETELFKWVPNDHGLHGNAILSRYPLRAPKLIPLDDSGLWYTSAPKQDGQLRVGGRMALTALVDLASGPIALASVHFESESDAQGRAAQTETLLAGLETAHGVGPTLIGGDLNTSALSGLTTAECLFETRNHEPCFATFSDADFAWQTANTGAPTTRAAPGRPVRYPLARLDWLIARGLSAYAPAVHAAVSDRGAYLSDHELITAQVTL